MPAVGDTYSVRDGQTITIRLLQPDLLEVEAVWQAAEGRPPRHHHPTQDEQFEMLEGELTFELGREERVVRAGEKIEIPRRTVHRVWNAGAGVARARWRIAPAQRTAEMFAALDGGLNPLRGARILLRFRDEFRLSLR
ncbi:MAG: cupin domain-containing protein [Solirubrobacteraceae bacterium]